MKILSAEQIYEADKFTIQKQQITSDALMERAALGIFNWMHGRLQGNPIKIHLFCGIGNNGGDGLALARHLKEHGYDIAVYVVNYSEKRSPDFLLNLDRLKERKLWPAFLDESQCTVPLGAEDIVVDAIFGIGLNRNPAPWVGDLIGQINTSGAFVLSLDMPSGLFVDRVPEHPEWVVRANHVLSFQAAKLPFFLPETGIYLNQWEVLDIGLDPEYMAMVQTAYHLTGKYEVQPIYRPRLKFSHKGTYGHALIIGGAYGKIGAVTLATKACLAAGAGLVTAYVPQCGYIPLQTGVPEAMVLTDESNKTITHISIPFTPKAVALGMGMGTDDAAIQALEQFLQEHTAALVLDADALNILAKKPALLKLLPKGSVLTPHPKELERLLGNWENDFDKLQKAHAFTLEHSCVLVVKGAHSMVLANGVGHINTSGNPGMATAGSGDVLSGIIAGLLAQGYQPLQAAVFGVYLHGLSGDVLSAQEGFEAITASKLIDGLGSAFIELFRREEREGQQPKAD